MEIYDNEEIYEEEKYSYNSDIDDYIEIKKMIKWIKI